MDGFQRKRLNGEEIEIRMETKDDWYNVELMTQHAFWNKHHLGCDEHYLVHKLRQDKDYLPELSRIAVKDGEVIGCIMYSKARVVDGTDTHEIITFGPLCVEPKWQGCGVGELLLRETNSLDKGYLVIFNFNKNKEFKEEQITVQGKDIFGVYPMTTCRNTPTSNKVGDNGR